MRRWRVALATYADKPDLAPDDRPLVAALAFHGIDASAEVWSNLAADWSGYDAVIVRSCWDYHLRSAEFDGWLDHLVRAGVTVWNSPALVRWNANKRYLLDLEVRGITTVPTVVIRRGQGNDVCRAAGERGWTRFVIKPAVSASGYETHLLRLPLADESRNTVDRVTSLGDTLVQPFIDEVAAAGELSFTFIDGVYSHATLKSAAVGEFRVQTDHGGRVDPAMPGLELVHEAERVIAALPEVPLYARVDAVVRNGTLLLMELELIEPNLFLAFGNGAASRLASAVSDRLKR